MYLKVVAGRITYSGSNKSTKIFNENALNEINVHNGVLFIKNNNYIRKAKNTRGTITIRVPKGMRFVSVKSKDKDITVKNVTVDTLYLSSGKGLLKVNNTDVKVPILRGRN